jgi:acyl carrier protein phosphodiesterase
MNHLAHLFLSQHDVDLLVGNFIADHVKGKKILNYTQNVQRGIRMHRAIDDFTDSHPIVQESKERLYENYHKYAPVIVDMFYDHILAKNWKNYSPITLKSFSHACYKTLASMQADFPETSQRFLFYMEKGDWLSSYATFDGIGQALAGLSRRATFKSKMEISVVDLERDFMLYEAEFERFFPLLHEFSINWVEKNK